VYQPCARTMASAGFVPPQNAPDLGPSRGAGHLTIHQRGRDFQCVGLRSKTNLMD
jgi:hypothetical protein